MSRETQRQILVCEHPFSDKPKIITGRTAVRPSNKPRMFNEDPIRFILEFAKIIERIICGVKCYLLFTVEASECRTKLLHVKKSVTN